MTAIYGADWKMLRQKTMPICRQIRSERTMTREEHKCWILSCPCNDCNFKNHLKQAHTDDIKELINTLPEKGNKSKIAALIRELKLRSIQ